MKIAYLDCFSGISGDMLLGALVDSGADLARLEGELRRLPLHGWHISAQKVKRGAIAATRVKVEKAHDAHHRALDEILELIRRAGLSSGVAAQATKIFHRLAEAEAKIHSIPVEKVHFHEVGAVDAILDIVGACVGWEMLGLEELVCSPLNLGSGRVRTEHGIFPVPAPATAELLRGAPTYSTGIEHELVTPTGAAIAATLAAQFGPLPPMTVSSVGYGAGAADLEEQPNVLRVFIGQAATRPSLLRWDDTVAVIEANLDDMNPQIYGYFVERAMAAGALDVFAAPVQMKRIGLASF